MFQVLTVLPLVSVLGVGVRADTRSLGRCRWSVASWEGGMLTPVPLVRARHHAASHTQLLPVMEMCARMRGASDWLALAATVLLCMLTGVHVRMHLLRVVQAQRLQLQQAGGGSHNRHRAHAGGQAGQGQVQRGCVCPCCTHMADVMHTSLFLHL